MEKQNNRMTWIHQGAEIDKTVFIDNLCTIGKNIILEKDVYISKGVSIYGKVLIKEGSFIGENCVIGHPQRDQLNMLIQKKLPMVEIEGPETRINNRCTIRAGTIIYSDVKIGEKCQTGHHVMIRENTLIGNFSLIGTNSVIDGNAVIGDNVSIQTGVYIPVNSKIGNNVFMGPYSKLTNDKYMMRRHYDLKGPTLEDSVSLGANSVVLPGVTLKKNTIVGAGSVVIHNTEENDIIVGNPAKFLKKIPGDWQ